MLQADAYGGYRALFESVRITEAVCLAHARRKIHDVHARVPSDITTESPQRIGDTLCHRGRGLGAGDVQQNSVGLQEKPELRH